MEKEVNVSDVIHQMQSFGEIERGTAKTYKRRYSLEEMLEQQRQIEAMTFAKDA